MQLAPNVAPPPVVPPSGVVLPGVQTSATQVSPAIVQSESDRHWTQLLLLVSHAGVVPPQSEFDRHSTQLLVAVSQTGVEAEQSASDVQPLVLAGPQVQVEALHTSGDRHASPLQSESVQLVDDATQEPLWQLSPVGQSLSEVHPVEPMVQVCVTALQT